MCSRFIPLFSRFLTLVLLLGSTAQAADPSLIGWWPLDEASGETAFDASGNGNDGTVSEDTRWVLDGGRWGGAILLEGPDTAHIEISAAEMSASAGTVMMWGCLSEPQPAQTRYFFGHTTQPSYANRIQLYMDGTTELDLGLGGAHAARTDIVTLPTETWLHVAMTWDNGSYALYLDGESIATGSYTGLTDIYDIAWIGNDGNPDSQGTEAFGGMLDEVRLYNRALTQAEVQAAMQTGFGYGLAGAPTPADGATDILRDAVLAWTAGPFAQTHDVYFGTSFDDVNEADRANPGDVLLSQGQTAVTCVPESVFAYGQTYYWRIDEVNGAPDNTIFKGNVWRFTAEPLAYAVENVTASASVTDAGADPENTINGSGLNENDEHSTDNTDMWLGTGNGVDPVWIQYDFDRTYKLHELCVWNYNIQFEPMLGFGLKNVTLEYSSDGIDWTVFGDVEFAQATAKADYTANTVIGLDGIQAKYVRFTVNSAYGTRNQYGLSEVRFSYIPVAARQPQPGDTAADVNPDVTLAWRAGRNATTHEVYLSTDEQAVLDGAAMMDTVAEGRYDAGALDLGATYYWKINEVNETEAIPSWEGSLWSFSTPEFIVLDDFESYNDDDNRIYETWLDGWVNETRSTVGYFEAPFAEQTIVNGGAQSMPLQYDNSAAPFYSEAERNLGGMDFATNGADTLRVSVVGEAPAFFASSDGSIFMNAIGADIWGTADEFRYAYKNLSGDGTMVARIDGLLDTDVWAKAGVMIRETLEPGSTFAAVYVAGNNGVRYQARLETDTDAVSDSSIATDEQVALRGPVWVKIERIGSTFNGYYATDGTDWTAMAWNPQTIDMATDVTIGLALTSHNTDVTTGAAFAGVAETGGVSGNWQMAEIGVAQPTAGGNEPEDVYVALEDGAGHVATVTYPNATAMPSWQEWLIPLGDFGGVNLSNVKTMVIGVGDRNTPRAGGTGLIFIDDIGIGHPASGQ